MGLLYTPWYGGRPDGPGIPHRNIADPCRRRRRGPHYPPGLDDARRLAVQVTRTIVAEARYGILSGVMAAFGRVMAEVGAILIVGGNIAGRARVMTTAIALETDKGKL